MQQTGSTMDTYSMGNVQDVQDVQDGGAKVSSRGYFRPPVPGEG